MEVGAAGDPKGVWGDPVTGTYIIPHGVSPAEQLCLWTEGIVRVCKGMVGKMGWGGRRGDGVVVLGGQWGLELQCWFVILFIYLFMYL